MTPQRFRTLLTELVDEKLAFALAASLIREFGRDRAIGEMVRASRPSNVMWHTD